MVCARSDALREEPLEISNTQLSVHLMSRDLFENKTPKFMANQYQDIIF